MTTQQNINKIRYQKQHPVPSLFVDKTYATEQTYSFFDLHQQTPRFQNHISTFFFQYNPDKKVQQATSTNMKLSGKYDDTIYIPRIPSNDRPNLTRSIYETTILPYRPKNTQRLY